MKLDRRVIVSGNTNTTSTMALHDDESCRVKLSPPAFGFVGLLSLNALLGGPYDLIQTSA
jgi:hypothetical protein